LPDWKQVATARTREDAEKLIPPGGFGAEIGVETGAHAKALMAGAKPAHLWLIDPWLSLKAEFPWEQRVQAQANEQFESVLAMFAAERQDGRVSIIRKRSLDAAPEIPDGSLDWLYIDGNHAFPYPLADLLVYERKLRPDGFIMLHDFCNAAPYGIRFGVIDSVSWFRALRPLWALQFITPEAYPTAFLARKTA
jgi:hypothetical protein